MDFDRPPGRFRGKVARTLSRQGSNRVSMDMDPPSPLSYLAPSTLVAAASGSFTPAALSTRSPVHSSPPSIHLDGRSIHLDGRSIHLDGRSGHLDGRSGHSYQPPAGPSARPVGWCCLSTRSNSARTYLDTPAGDLVMSATDLVGKTTEPIVRTIDLVAISADLGKPTTDLFPSAPFRLRYLITRTPCASTLVERSVLVTPWVLERDHQPPSLRARRVHVS